MGEGSGAPFQQASPPRRAQLRRQPRGVLLRDPRGSCCQIRGVRAWSATPPTCTRGGRGRVSDSRRRRRGIGRSSPLDMVDEVEWHINQHVGFYSCRARSWQGAQMLCLWQGELGLLLVIAASTLSNRYEPCRNNWPAPDCVSTWLRLADRPAALQGMLVCSGR